MVATLEYKHTEPLEAEPFASPLCCTYSETHVSVQVHTPEPSEAHKNQYVAFGNNPVMFRDPSGLCTDSGYPYSQSSSPNNTVSSVVGNIPFTPPPPSRSLPYDTPVLRAAPPRRPRRSDTVLIDPNNTIAARQFRASQYAPGADTSSIVGLLAAEQHGRAIGMAGGSFMGAATIGTTGPQMIRAGTIFYLSHPNAVNRGVSDFMTGLFGPPSMPQSGYEAAGQTLGIFRYLSGEE